MVLLQLTGRYILLSIIYPYQNSILRENLDRQNNERFGEEFAYYVKSFFYTLRVQSGLVSNQLDTDMSDRKRSKKSGDRNKSLASSSRTMDQPSEVIPFS